jgi:Uma2 family endonuclease
MSEAVRKMSLEEFDAWQPHQEVRCELVDGLIYAMTGATFAHDLIVGNLSFALANQLRANGSPCRPFTADIGLVTGPATLRRPDVSVYCPPFETRATRSSEPSLVAEVLSPSTVRVDQLAKMLEYRALPALRTILLLAPDQVDIGAWQREADGSWRYAHTLDDLSAKIELPEFGLSLAVRDIYEGADVRTVARPRLVWPDEPSDR